MSSEEVVLSLIDPVTTPYSEPDEIRAEIARIRLMPKCAGRDAALQMMSEWLERGDEPDVPR